MTKIAIPVSDGHFSRSFEDSTQFFIYNISINGIKFRRKQIRSDTIKDTEEIPQILAGHGVNFVFAGQVSMKMAKMLNDHKIQLYAGVPEQKPDQLVEDFLCGELINDNNKCF
jgi:predicted Fe-Mo cluster-binding NifX family protein